MNRAEKRRNNKIAKKGIQTLDIQKEINVGLQHHNAGDLHKAEVIYQKILQVEPNQPVVLHLLGLIARRVGKNDIAVDLITKALAIKPDLADAHCNLGNIFQDLGKLDEAEASFHKAIAIKPDYAEAHSNLGNIFQNLGRFDEAVSSYSRSLTVKPDFAEAYTNLGLALKALGRVDEALTNHNKALAIKPNFSDAHYNLGIALNDSGQPDEAVSSFQKAFSTRTSILPVGDDELAPAITGLYFELTNKCNFHCDFCPSDSQKRDIGSMDIELIKSLYEETADKKIATIVNLHLMGEPTLHPKLIEILSFAASKNVKTELVTNGSTLVAKVVPKVLDVLYGTIVASHMTPTEETYHYRGKVGLSWKRYISNLRTLVREYLKRLANGDKIRNNLTIRVMATQNTAANVSIVETKEEARAILKEWYDFVAEVEEELGMATFKRQDYNAKDLLHGNSHAAVSYPLQQGINLTYWKAFTFANTRVSDEFELQAEKKTAYCPHPFTDFGVLWNGDVTLCCLDHDGQLNVGNIRDSSIETLIQNEEAKKIRASMLGHHPLPSVCQTCQAKPVKREENSINCSTSDDKNSTS